MVTKEVDKLIKTIYKENDLKIKDDFSKEDFGWYSVEQTIFNKYLDQFIELADNGDVNAQFIIAEYYRAQSIFDYDRKKEYTAKYEHYYKMAADQKHIESLIRYSRMVEGEEKVKYLKMGADLDISTCLFDYGEIYFYGNGVKKDYTTAVEYFLKASKHDIPRAYTALAYCALHGLGIHKDLNLCVETLEEVKEDDKNAKLLLAELYLKGKGVSKNNKYGFNLLEELVNDSFTSAYYDYAMCLYKGNGVVKNINKAFKFFKAGAHSGCEKCKKMVLKLSKKIK